MKAEIPMSEVMGGLTMQCEVHVTGVRMAKFRIRLGGLILRIAARVIGCNIEIKGAE